MRSFWPYYPVLGEALLQCAEKLSYDFNVGVLHGEREGIHDQLEKQKRGELAKFYSIRTFTDSSSSVIFRIFENISFAFIVLIKLVSLRPRVIYISSDPPIFLPFISYLYSKIYKAQYLYHLHDIHPEAANIILPMNKPAFYLLQKLDNLSIASASKTIVLSSRMKTVLENRLDKTLDITVLNNPSVKNTLNKSTTKQNGIVFTGNAGRYQLMPLIIGAIEDFYDGGGRLPILFAGGGVYSDNLISLSEKYHYFSYLGTINPKDAASLASSYQWALLPIDERVLDYAFPSKASSYICMDSTIILICKQNNVLSDWILSHDLGYVIEPSHFEIIKTFKMLEEGKLVSKDNSPKREKVKKLLSMDNYVYKLTSLLREILDRP